MAPTTAANPPTTPPAIAPEFDFPSATKAPDPAAMDDALAEAEAELATAEDLLEVTNDDEEVLAPVEEAAAAVVDEAEVETLIPEAARRLVFLKRVAR